MATNRFLTKRSSAYETILAVTFPTLRLPPCRQPESLNFGRVYAAYGGYFILLSDLWGVYVDRKVCSLCCAHNYMIC